jgi:pectinesterase
MILRFLLALCFSGLLRAAMPTPTATLAPLPIKPDIVVAADGSGDFTSVHAAVQSIPKDSRERRVILVKNGVYHEKVRIDAACITLRGESRAGSRIEFAWANTQGRDALGTAVVNINGDDCVLENLTIENTDGVLGRHAFAVYGRGDRTVIQDCDVLSQGNDTLSLWRTANGMFSEDAATHTSANGRYYHTRLKVCGSVDFICPRGWCYLSDSEIIEVNPKTDAAMWHDGSRDQNMKFVMRNCRFEGPENYRLARHHHDALFFFVDCSFEKTMRDFAPYRVIYPLNGGTPTPADIKNNQDHDPTNIWGERAYYFNSHRDGGDYAWHKDNLASAPGAPQPADITAKWTFGGTWDPERTDAPRVVTWRHQAQPDKLLLTFSEPVTVKGKPRLTFPNGQPADFIGGSGTATLEFSSPAAAFGGVIPRLELNGGAIVACEAGATLRVAELKFQ